ncbi:hypothetical protein QBC37DRAFT_102642 [Rhypophila decipiens]|uniref:Nephrocystin 3-like N-terminal domain-containing protein n=1 Tax=Rhypophila decipiens TaxID=261697 RepID=A0AAN6XUQ2_9PEZI|nr:hypothetical protein QBC37DRAFT_102642 [Rhypophila decipiens]
MTTLDAWVNQPSVKCTQNTDRLHADGSGSVGIKHQVVNHAMVRKDLRFIIRQLEGMREEFAAHHEMTARNGQRCPPHHDRERDIDMCRLIWDRSRQDASTPSRVMEWLEKAHQSVGQGDGHSPAEGTGNWLLVDGSFVKWRTRKVPEILWILGQPGSGKSCLLETLTEHLQKTEGSLVIWCSLRQLRDPERSTPSALVASILFQVLQHNNALAGQPRIDAGLRGLIKTPTQNPHNCPFKKLWPVCLEALKIAAQSQHTFLVIDAWDECRFSSGDPQPSDFLKDLRDLSSSTSISVAISSRPDATILGLDPPPRLRVDIDQGLNSGDLHQFALREVQRSVIPSEYHSEVMEQIEAKAAGNFLWTRAFIEYLCQPCERQVFLERLHHSPPDFDTICDKMVRHHSKNLNQRQRDSRQVIYELVCGSAEPPSLEMVGRILHFGKYDYLRTVTEIAGPLVLVKDGRVTLTHLAVKEWLTKISTALSCSPDGALFVDPLKSHERLAEECLRILLELQYASKWRIGQYLHRNFARYAKLHFRLNIPLPDVEPETTSFQYAAKYWVYHLIRVPKPPRTLIDLAQNFIRGKQFAYWSEYSLDRDDNDFHVIRVAYSDLLGWVKTLPDCELAVTLKDYYSYPYEQLGQEYKESASEDRELQWLTNMSLARFFIDLGTALKAIPVLDETVTGLTNDLGNRNPLTIKARTERATLYFQQGPKKLCEAYEDFSQLTRIQKEVLGLDNPELYKTMLGLGGAEYFMNRYPEALGSIGEAGMGALRLCGPDSVQYMNTEVWISYVLVEIGRLDEALAKLSKLVQKRRKMYGDRDIYALQVQSSVGDIKRKLGQHAESLADLHDTVTFMRNMFHLDAIWSLDPTISYVIALRDFGKRKEALDLLGDIEKEAGLDPDSDERPLMHYRYCQVNHVRALLLSDGGRRDEAITLLQGILINTDRGRYNRPLLWIILDLAVLLRRRDKKGDWKQAEANFDHIVKVQTATAGQGTGSPGCDPDDEPEPDPPRLLRLAEKALVLVRTRKFQEVDELFEREEVEWFCPEDLWISFGSPAADTAWMKAP